jgi:4-amino-4-deoxychorismate lyase
MSKNQATLLESIRLENGHLPLLDYHQARVDRSRALLGWRQPLLLEPLLREQPLPQQGLHKLRVTYGRELVQVDCLPYVRRPVRSLRLLPAEGLDYALKWADRRALEHCFSLRGACDDVLLLQDGRLTDTSYANVALFDGQQWWTPGQPLLQGVRREFLLAGGVLQPAELRVADLAAFRCLRVFNAMIDLAEAEDIYIFDAGASKM